MEAVNTAELGGAKVFGRPFEEIANDDLRASVGAERYAIWNETGGPPIDHGGELLDDDEIGDARIFEGGAGRIAKPQTADEDIELVAIDARQRERGKLFLAARKLARHEKIVAQLHFENILLADTPAAQDKRPERSLLIVQFFVKRRQISLRF